MYVEEEWEIMMIGDNKWRYKNKEMHFALKQVHVHIAGRVLKQKGCMPDGREQERKSSLDLKCTTRPCIFGKKTTLPAGFYFSH